MAQAICDTSQACNEISQTSRQSFQLEIRPGIRINNDDTTTTVAFDKNIYEGLDEHRQIRDARILRAHVRAGRQVFLTDDTRGFIRDGRRQQFGQTFGTRIMTCDEFISEFAAK